MQEQKFCPYPGLRPFNEEESIFFKGREEQVQGIVKRLAEKKFLMINGASGDGKSSLMYAGVIPFAKAGFFKSQFDNWAVVNFRPERRPLSNFASAFCDTLQLPDKTKIEKEFGYGFSSLIDLYKSSEFYFDDENTNEKRLRRKAANLLILVDQFEEFFTNSENYLNGVPSLESQKTVNLLIETYKIAVAQNLPVYVVCTMRSDYIGQCAVFRGLPEAIGFSQFFVPRLKRHELEQVIEGPAKLSGASVNKNLVQFLLNSTGEGFDQLPILQHALNSVWKMANNGAQEMEKIHLAKVGGISTQALSSTEKNEFEKWFATLPDYKKKLLEKPSLNNVLNAHANELLEFLPEHYNALTQKTLSKETIERIVKISFQCLTVIDNGRAVRRRTTLTEITSIINDTAIREIDVSAVLQIFREQGNTFLQPFVGDAGENTNLQPETVLDITHESLIRNWNLLGDWAQEENENYTVWLEIEKQLNRWLSNKESANFLLAQGPLSYYEDWQIRFKPNKYWLLKYDDAKTNSNEKLQLAGKKIDALNKFIAQSRNAIKRKRSVLIYAVSAAFVVLGLFTMWSLVERNNALTQEKLAIQKTKEAEKSSEIASLNKKIAEDKQREAIRLGDIAEEEKNKALIAKDAAEKAKHEALAAKAIAEKEKLKAEQQTLLATNETQKAEAQRKVADDAKDKALSAELKSNQLSQAAMAQNLAYKSTQIEDNNELQGLLALYAYNFTQKSKSDVQDPIIYEALRAYYTKLYHQKGIKNGCSLPGKLTGEPKSLAFVKSENKIIAAGTSDSLSYFDPISGLVKNKLIEKYKNKNAVREFILLSPNGEKIIYGYSDGTVKLIHLNNKVQKNNINSEKILSTIALRCAAFSANSEYLAIATKDSGVYIYSLANNRDSLVRFEKIKTSPVNALAIPNKEGYAYLGLQNGNLGILPISAYELKLTVINGDSIYQGGGFYEFHSEESAVKCLDYSEKLRLLAIGFENGKVKLGGKDFFGKHLSGVEHLAFNMDGSLLASSGADKSIRIFNTTDMRLKPILLNNQNEKVRSLLFLDDTKLIAGGESKIIWIWELSSVKLAESLCEKLKSKRMSLLDWYTYVGKKIEIENACN